MDIKFDMLYACETESTHAWHSFNDITKLFYILGYVIETIYYYSIQI